MVFFGCVFYCQPCLFLLQQAAWRLVFEQKRPVRSAQGGGQHPLHVGGGASGHPILVVGQLQCLINLAVIQTVIDIEKGFDCKVGRSPSMTTHRNLFLRKTTKLTVWNGFKFRFLLCQTNFVRSIFSTHVKGAQVWDIRSLGFSWFLHHKVFMGTVKSGNVTVG